MTAPRRVAVLGVPRGGTSAVVGLLRILGYVLPPTEFGTVCHQGEARRLRSIENGGRALEDVLLDIAALPDGTVWKDPTVGSYAERLWLGGWDIVQVHRPLRDVSLSESRWTGQMDDAALRSRARTWYESIEGRLRRGDYGRLVHVEWDEARRDPALTLLGLSTALGRPEPTWAALRAARSFIAQESGYTCPIPGECGLPHPEDVTRPGRRRPRP